MERFVNKWTDKWSNLSDLQKYFITGMMGATGVTMLQYTTGFLSSLLFGRVLGADGYGILANAMQWLIFLGMPIGAVFRNLLVRRWPLASDREKELLSGWTIKLGSVIAILVVVIFLIIIENFSIFNDESVAEGVKLAMLGFVFFALVQAISALFTAEKKPAVAILFMRAWLPVGTFLLGATYFFLTNSRNPYDYVYFTIVVCIVGVIVGLWWLRWRRANLVRISNIIKAPFLMERIKTLVYFALITFLGTSSFTLPPILLGVLSNAEELGVFHIAMRFIGPVIVANILMLNVLMPIVSELYHNGEYQRLLRVLYKPLLLVSIGAVVVAVFVGGLLYFILPILKDPAYYRSFPVFIVMVIAVLLNVFSGNTHMLLNIAHKENFVLIAQMIAMVLQLAVSFVLIPKYGAMGAGFAFLAGPPVSKWISYMVVRKKLGLSISFFDALIWYIGRRR